MKAEATRELFAHDMILTVLFNSAARLGGSLGFNPTDAFWIRDMATHNGTRHGAKRRARLPAPILRDLVRRVVAQAQPEKIILFGSAARGTMGRDSDVDLLVIKRGKFKRARLVEAIYRGLRGAEAAVDVIVVTPEEVERYRDEFCLVIYPALREGKVVYVA
jgi:uncharacterized protein